MEKQLFLLDIDGTICRGSALIPGARAFLQRIRQAGGQYIFITNNATPQHRGLHRLFPGAGR